MSAATDRESSSCEGRSSYAPKSEFIALMAMFSLASISAFGQSGDKAKVKGMINSRTGETLIVKTAQGNVTVVLTDSTKTKDNKGLLGARNDWRPPQSAVEIPPLHSCRNRACPRCQARARDQWLTRIHRPSGTDFQLGPPVYQAAVRGLDSPQLLDGLAGAAQIGQFHLRVFAR